MIFISDLHNTLNGKRCNLASTVSDEELIRFAYYFTPPLIPKRGLNGILNCQANEPQRERAISLGATSVQSLDELEYICI